MADRIIRQPTFHEHLDECERCRTQPFNLCPFGARALMREATEILTDGFAVGTKPAGLPSKGGGE